MSEPQKPTAPKPRRIPFWRLGFGLILLLGSARHYLAPGLELNRAANLSEQQGMDAANVIFLLLGAWLILTFVHLTMKKHDQ
jgi:hypothetical protein